MPMNQTSNYQKGHQDLSTIAAALTQLLQLSEKQTEEARPLVLTTQQVASELQVSLPTLRDHFLCRPDFPKIRAGTKYLIPRKAFEQWINGQS